ncbi:MAG: type I-E CRISPR-associated endonuclease Cas1e [Clostridiales bacterium]|jgi:CRISPR-associated protein Cas1|nr:type I-E CRISPR-associated endonuclease Cas1e [Clostridiales bacterium]
MKISANKPKLQSISQIKERISFLYVERCVINRADNAVTIADMRGVVHVPAATLSVLLLGPGTKITHRAVELVGDMGITIIWVGEYGVRYYAHGRPLTHSSKMIVRQAALVSNTRSRLAVARKMYALRFPDEDVSNLGMQQLRGKEGARIRATYRKFSKITGVAWSGRVYDPDDFEAGTPVNKALSAAHACLYGLAHSAIVALGLSAALGFIHSGHERSFVYDVADLYKASLTIPIAFEIAAAHSESEDIGALTRRAVRDKISNMKLLAQMVKDIHLLLHIEDADVPDVDILHLWDDKQDAVKSGMSYGREDELDEDEGEELGYGEILED